MIPDSSRSHWSIHSPKEAAAAEEEEDIHTRIYKTCFQAKWPQSGATPRPRSLELAKWSAVEILNAPKIKNVAIAGPRDTLTLI